MDNLGDFAPDGSMFPKLPRKAQASIRSALAAMRTHARELPRHSCALEAAGMCFRTRLGPIGEAAVRTVQRRFRARRFLSVGKLQRQVRECETARALAEFEKLALKNDMYEMEEKQARRLRKMEKAHAKAIKKLEAKISASQKLVLKAKKSGADEADSLKKQVKDLENRTATEVARERAGSAAYWRDKVKALEARRAIDLSAMAFARSEIRSILETLGRAGAVRQSHNRSRLREVLGRLKSTGPGSTAGGKTAGKEPSAERQQRATQQAAHARSDGARAQRRGDQAPAPVKRRAHEGAPTEPQVPSDTTSILHRSMEEMRDLLRRIEQERLRGEPPSYFEESDVDGAGPPSGTDTADADVDVGPHSPHREAEIGSPALHMSDSRHHPVHAEGEPERSHAGEMAEAEGPGAVDAVAEWECPPRQHSVSPPMSKGASKSLAGGQPNQRNHFDPQADVSVETGAMVPPSSGGAVDEASLEATLPACHSTRPRSPVPQPPKAPTGPDLNEAAIHEHTQLTHEVALRNRAAEEAEDPATQQQTQTQTQDESSVSDDGGEDGDPSVAGGGSDDGGEDGDLSVAGSGDDGGLLEQDRAQDSPEYESDDEALSDSQAPSTDSASDDDDDDDSDECSESDSDPLG